MRVLRALAMASMMGGQMKSSMRLDVAHVRARPPLFGRQVRAAQQLRHCLHRRLAHLLVEIELEQRQHDARHLRRARAAGASGRVSIKSWKQQPRACWHMPQLGLKVLLRLSLWVEI